MDASGLEIAARAAQVTVAEAGATLHEAEDAAGREEDLFRRGAGSLSRPLQANVVRDVAKARLAAAEAALDLRRARVVAPIGGRIGRLLVAPGAYVEAIAGAALAEIVSVDPVLLSYSLRDDTRMAAMAEAGVAAFERMALTQELPDDTPYPVEGPPMFENASVDPSTGMLTIWAEFENPCRALPQGLSVRVRAMIRAGREASQ